MITLYTSRSPIFSPETLDWVLGARNLEANASLDPALGKIKVEIHNPAHEADVKWVMELAECEVQ